MGDLDLLRHDGRRTRRISGSKAAQCFCGATTATAPFTDIFRRQPGWESTATGAGPWLPPIFNNDRAIDFVFRWAGSKGAAIYLNPREGKFFAAVRHRFHKRKSAPPAVGVVSVSISTKDGWMDLGVSRTPGAAGASVLWRNVEGKRLEAGCAA